MAEHGITWNKILAFCGVIGIPLLSAIFAAALWAIRLDDKLTGVILTQQEQGQSLKALNDKVDNISVRVDTVTSRQKDSKRDIDYRLREIERSKR